jgi:hypothetical protein
MNDMAEQPAERQLITFLAKFDPAVARVARTARTKLRRLLPGTMELVYDNYNALAIGFGPTDRASDVIMSIAMYPRWVSVFFMRGAGLPDPTGVLKGGGKQVRHFVLAGPAMLDLPAVKALIRAALSAHPKPLAHVGRRRTIIKSVASKQRPRRPQEPRGRRTMQ